MTADPPRRAKAAQKPPATININLRASAALRDLIDRAATLQGKTRTEFMLDSARRSAEDVMLDQTLFRLDANAFKALERILNSPPKPAPALKKLLKTAAPWER